MSNILKAIGGILIVILPFLLLWMIWAKSLFATQCAATVLIVIVCGYFVEGFLKDNSK